MGTTQYAELELSLERQDADSFAVDLRFTLPDSEADQRGKAENICIAIDELRQLADDPAAYGRRLGQDFFAFPGVREVLAVVQSSGVDLRFRLSISPTDRDLQGLRWETLADPDAPQPGAPLLMSERVLFSRYVDSRDWRQVARRAKGDLRALVVVANPSDLDSYRLAPIDVTGEIKRARDGMVGINKIDILGESDRATKPNIIDRLKTGPDIFYLVCHGALIDGKSMLWLEDDAGKAERVDGATVVSWLSELKQPPRLVVLISCQSAGTGDGGTAVAAGTVEVDALGALGPRLGSAGVPAVLAMHGNVTMSTVEAFMPKFFSELQKDGLVDRAVALARGAVRDRPDAWAPVLYMRLKRGSLWSQSGFAIDESGEPYEGWPALLHRINASKCTPILGAGMTESLIGPRREVAQRWAKTYRFPLAPDDQDDLPQVAQFVYVNQKDRQLLLDELRDSVRAGLLAQLGNDITDELRNAPNDALLLELGKRRWASNTDEPHWVLAQAPFPIFVTTALDGLLTEALKAAGKDPREELFRWNDDEGWPPLLRETEPDYVPTPEKPLVYHLFGHLGVDHSLVITEDDYFDYLIGATKNRDQIPHYVRAALAETALLFLGFEMDGWDFRVLFRSIMTQQVQRSRRMQIAHAGVQIDLIEGQILEIDRARRYLESYFEDSNIHIYWGSVEDFSRELRQQRGNTT
jgi:hypothetical protein